VTAVEREGDPHSLAIVAADLEAIGTPAPITFIDRDAAVMPALGTTGMAIEQKAMDLHHPVSRFETRASTASVLAVALKKNQARRSSRHTKQRLSGQRPSCRASARAGATFGAGVLFFAENRHPVERQAAWVSRAL